MDPEALYKLHRRLVRGRPDPQPWSRHYKEPIRCQECGAATEHGKPYCTGHLMMIPEALALATVELMGKSGGRPWRTNRLPKCLAYCSKVSGYPRCKLHPEHEGPHQTKSGITWEAT